MNFVRIAKPLQNRFFQGSDQDLGTFTGSTTIAKYKRASAYRVTAVFPLCSPMDWFRGCGVSGQQLLQPQFPTSCKLPSPHSVGFGPFGAGAVPPLKSPRLGLLNSYTSAIGYRGLTPAHYLGPSSAHRRRRPIVV